MCQTVKSLTKTQISLFLAQHQNSFSLTVDLSLNKWISTRLKLWFKNDQCIRIFDFPNSTHIHT